MKNVLKCVVVGIALGCAGGALADPKPKGAKAVDAQTVANMYGGKSLTWKGCKGGIYYGPNFEAQAYCNKNGKSVGVGKWNVSSKGSLCHNLTWYWPQDDGYGSKPQDKKECIHHLVDGDGQIWRNWSGNKDWWRMNRKTI